MLNKPLQDYSLFHLVNRVADMVLLSILWVVCSLPIVTVGVASAALYHTVVLVVMEERGNVFSGFLHSLRDSWRQALPIGALLTALCGFLAYLLYGVLTSGLEGLWLLFTAGMILFLHLSLLQIHLYPLIGHFVLTGHQLFSLEIRLTSSFFLRNAALLMLLAGAVALALWYPPLLLILPAGYALLAAKLQGPMFEKFIHTPPKADELPEEEP